MYKSKKIILILIILEIIAIIIHSSEDIKDVLIYNSYVEELIGYIYLNKYYIHHYFSLDKENEMLHKENSLLINKIINMKNDYNVNNIHSNMNFVYINAKIIHQNKNFLILNKGLLDGVQKNMGVISPKNGIIGIITHCTTHFSRVTLIINTNTRISAKIKFSNYSGTLYWNGINYKIMELIGIPQYIKIKIGEYIETDGKSNIFPQGIRIGKIINYKCVDENNTYIIKIKLCSNINAINNVYVIKNNYNQELASITL